MTCHRTIGPWKRLNLLALLVYGLCAFALAQAAPKETFTCSIPTDLATLDPSREGRSSVSFVPFAVFQGMSQNSYDDGLPIPALAESWEVENPTTWRFTIRRGVKFQNGEEMNAQDVKYSFYRQMGRINPDYPGASKGLWEKMVESIETPDDYTVLIKTRQPEVILPYQVISGSVYILPREYLEKVGDEEFGRRPYGTGPFMYKERRPSESIELEAFAGYWNQNPAPGAMGPARVKRVVYRVIPQGQTAIAAFRAGEIDAVIDLNVDQARALENTKDTKVYYSPSSRPRYIMMGWREPTDPETGKPNPFYDVRVRQAVNHAVDVESLIKNYGTGKERQTTLVSRSALGYNPDVPRYEYNPPKARELLAEAGYPKGFDTQFWVLADRPPYQEAITQYLRQAGINARFKIVTVPVVLRALMRKKFSGMVEFVGGVGADPTIGWFKVIVGDEGRFSTHAHSDEFERLMAAQYATFDQKERGEIINKIVQLMWREAWFLPLWEPVVMKALNTTRWAYDEPLAASRSFALDRIKPRP